MIGMTRDEQEIWQERVAIMLAEIDPAGMSDDHVEAVTVAIEATATKQIMDARQRTIDRKLFDLDEVPA